MNTVISKYNDYLETANLKIAETIDGQWYCWEVDEVSGELFNFTPVKDSTELEMIITNHIISSANNLMFRTADAVMFNSVADEGELKALKKNIETLNVSLKELIPLLVRISELGNILS